jgi:hypothetical protein
MNYYYLVWKFGGNMQRVLIGIIALSISATFIPSISASLVYAKENAKTPKAKFNWDKCMARKKANGVAPRDAINGCQKLKEERS